MTNDAQLVIRVRLASPFACPGVLSSPVGRRLHLGIGTGGDSARRDAREAGGRTVNGPSVDVRRWKRVCRPGRAEGNPADAETQPNGLSVLDEYLERDFPSLVSFLSSNDKGRAVSSEVQPERGPLCSFFLSLLLSFLFRSIWRCVGVRTKSTPPTDSIESNEAAERGAASLSSRVRSC